MNGVVVVRSLLANDADLLAKVPDSRIMSGPLPQGTQAPALSVASISQVDLNIPAPSGTKFVTERVQVTVLANSYREKKEVLLAVKRAAADKRPTTSGLTGVSVHTDSTSADAWSPEESLFEQSQDFKVKFNQEI